MLEFISTYPIIFGPLFVLFVVGLGGLIVWTAETSPLAPFFQRRSGIVAPYGNIPAVLFGLVIAFTMQDIWTGHTRAETAVAREADAIRIIRTIVRALGDRGAELDRLVVDYATATAGDDWRSPSRSDAADAMLRQMLNQSLFGPVAQAGPQGQRAVLDAVADIRASRRERLAVGGSHKTGMKWVAAFLLGIVTQIAVAFVHLGKPRTSMMAVTLFSIAMGFITWITLVRIDVFAGRGAISLESIVAASRSSI